MSVFDYLNICVTNRHLCTGDFLQQMRVVCSKRPDMVILREKDLSSEEYYKLAYQMKEITNSYQLDLTGHYFWETCLELELNRMHLPLSVFEENALRIRKSFSLVGVSVHSLEEGLIAQGLGADYVMYGHIFQTPSKEGLAPRGLEALEGVCSGLEIPVYGIGGITSGNMSSVLQSGAKGICQMSAYMGL